MMTGINTSVKNLLVIVFCGFLAIESVNLYQIVISNGAFIHPRGTINFSNYGLIYLFVISVIFYLITFLSFLYFWRVASDGLYSQSVHPSQNQVTKIVNIVFIGSSILVVIFGIAVFQNVANRFMAAGTAQNLLFLVYKVVCFVALAVSRNRNELVTKIAIIIPALVLTGTRSPVLFILLLGLGLYVGTFRRHHLGILAPIGAFVYFSMLYLRWANAGFSFDDFSSYYFNSEFFERIRIALGPANLLYGIEGNLSYSALSFLKETLFPYFGDYIFGDTPKAGEFLANSLNYQIFLATKSQVPIGLNGELYITFGPFAFLAIPVIFYSAAKLCNIFCRQFGMGLVSASVLYCWYFFILCRNGVTYHGQLTVPILFMLIIPLAISLGAKVSRSRNPRHIAIDTT